MGRGRRLFLCALFWITAAVIIPGVLANYCPAIHRTGVINTTLGPVQGFCDAVLNSTIYSFLGIPFAQPPVGRLRFRRPIPIKPWRDVFAAMKMPPRCKQASVLSREDCLYLNVWTPTLDASEKLDVMVYFHGGAFVFERPLMQRDLRYMAALGNVVIVKMNYRLGAFGFLYSTHEEAPGNMGLYDQYLALLFVKDNIHLFGGDPEKITAFGNSAGAMSIGLMTTSPLAGPLIKRAILQSGSPCVSIIARENRSLELADKLAYRTGCAFSGMSIATRSRQILSCLRRVEADKIVAVQSELFASIEVYLPVFGDAMIPVHILTALKRGLFNRDLKLLIGVTPDEGTSILSTASPQFFQRDSHRKVSKSELLSTCNRTFLHSFSKAKLRRIYWNYMGLLGHTSYLTQRAALSNCIADYFMLCPAHQFAQELSRKVFAFTFMSIPDQTGFRQTLDMSAKYCHVIVHFLDTKVYGVPKNKVIHGYGMLYTEKPKKGVDTYFYLFDYRTKNSITPPWMGVVHTAELYYLFGEPYSTNWYNDEEREFSKTIVEIWSTFAKTGQPPKRLRWPKYLWSRPRYLRLHPRKFAPGRGPREQWCSLWNDPLQ